MNEYCVKLVSYMLSSQTRHLLPSGLKKLLVSNVREVDLLLMHNKSFAAEIAHNVSSRKRTAMLERCVDIRAFRIPIADIVIGLTGQKYLA